MRGRIQFRIYTQRRNIMFIPEAQHHLTVLVTSAHFLYTRIYSLNHNVLRWITPDRVFRNRIVCAVPSGMFPYPPNSFCPRPLLSDLSSAPLTNTPHYIHLSSYTSSSSLEIDYILKQKSFQGKCGIMYHFSNYFSNCFINHKNYINSTF